MMKVPWGCQPSWDVRVHPLILSLYLSLIYWFPYNSHCIALLYIEIINNKEACLLFKKLRKWGVASVVKKGNGTPKKLEAKIFPLKLLLLCGGSRFRYKCPKTSLLLSPVSGWSTLTIFDKQTERLTTTWKSLTLDIRILPTIIFLLPIAPYVISMGKTLYIYSSCVRTQFGVGRSCFLSLTYLGCLVLTFEEICIIF